jgi:hypothetical protein
MPIQSIIRQCSYHINLLIILIIGNREAVLFLAILYENVDIDYRHR